MNRITNKAGLANFFEVTTTAVDGWVSRGCPIQQKGSRGRSWKFDLLEVAKWRFSPSDAEVSDPEKMPPERRLKFYQAEQARDELMVSRRQLIPADEVEVGTNALIKDLVCVLETLPDLLERDAGLDHRQTALVISQIDGFRNRAYEQLKQSGS